MKIASRLYGQIFSSEIVNDGRQEEIDLAKACMIFCLALIHCTIECTPLEKLVSGIPYLFDSIIGGPLSAPMYMFAMGIGMVYTKHHTPKDYAKRGLKLGVIGYMLNICRYLIPFLVGYLITGNYEKYVRPLPYRVLGNDILQFASLAMLTMALFVWLRMSHLTMFMVSLAMSVLGTFLRGLDIGIPLGNIFLGYIVGIEDAKGMVFSDFPLLNWMIFPVSGYIFGQYLLHVKNKNLFYRLLSPIGILITAIYFPLGIINRWGMFGDGQNCYYHMITGDALVSLSVTTGVLGIYHVLIPYISDRRKHYIGEISKNINVIYCIHWVLVVISTNLVLYILRGTQELSVAATLFLGTGISVISIQIAHVWSKRKRQ